MPHRDTSVAIRQAITSALNATQGHKHSYQTSYYFTSYMTHRDTSIANRQTITLALNSTQGHRHWLSIKPLIDLYPITIEVWFPPEYFNVGTITLHCNQSGVLIRSYPNPTFKGYTSNSQQYPLLYLHPSCIYINYFYRETTIEINLFIK